MSVRDELIAAVARYEQLWGQRLDLKTEYTYARDESSKPSTMCWPAAAIHSPSSSGPSAIWQAVLEKTLDVERRMGL